MSTFDSAVRAYVDTTAARDTAGFMDLMHDDVTVVLADGDVLAGRSAVAGFVDGFFADRGWTQTFTVLRQVRAGRTGFVLFDSRYAPSGGRPPKPLVIGVTFVEEDGRWRVLHNQDSAGPAR